MKNFGNDLQWDLYYVDHFQQFAFPATDIASSHSSGFPIPLGDTFSGDQYFAVGRETQEMMFC